jgi:hypothetical protein
MRVTYGAGGEAPLATDTATLAQRCVPLLKVEGPQLL